MTALMTAAQQAPTNNKTPKHGSRTARVESATLETSMASTSGLAAEPHRRKDDRKESLEQRSAGAVGAKNEAATSCSFEPSNPNGSSEALSSAEHWPAPTLAASFSFNSYQDIICPGFASSTFAAADVRRTLAGSNNAAEGLAELSQAQPELSRLQQARREKQQQLAKFRVHSRHISVGGRFADWLLAAVPKESSSVGGRTRERQEHTSPVVVAAATQPAATSNRNSIQIVNSNSSPKSAINETTNSAACRRTRVSLASLDRVGTTQEAEQRQGAKEQSRSNSGRAPSQKHASKQEQRQHRANQREKAPTNMSQTLQSLQSLSLQLNRATSLRNSSQGEMTSALSSLAVHSPFGGAGFAPADAGDCALLPVGGGFGANNNNAGTGGGGNSSSQANKFSRLVGKKATRVKELLLQNLGKADKTTDELFEMHEESFYRQQNQAIKLQKEFKSYLSSLKGAQEANKSLNCCIQQSTGDYQSARHDLVCENLSQLEHLNEDLMEKLRQQIAASISEYLAQFGELRDKISKRKRKLIDYDSSRRVYEATLAGVNRKRQSQQLQQQQQQLAAAAEQAAASGGLSSIQQGGGSARESIFQSATSQLINEARLLKLREQHNYCKLMYETINSELHEELPMVYEKKMKHLLVTLQNYFSLEAQFHSNASKLFATASDFIDELPMSYQRQRQQQQNGANSINGQLASSVSSGGSQARGDGEMGSGSANEQDAAEGATSVGSCGDHEVDEYGPAANRLIGKAGGAASGSSGVGSSRGGDSSLESSSSPDASSSGSPTNEEHDDHATGCQEDETEQAGGEDGAVVASCGDGVGEDEDEDADEQEESLSDAGKELGVVRVAAGSRGAQSESELADRVAVGGAAAAEIGGNGAKSDEPLQSSKSGGVFKAVHSDSPEQLAVAAAEKAAVASQAAEEFVISAIVEAIAQQPNAIGNPKEESSQEISNQGGRAKAAAASKLSVGKPADLEGVTCLYKVKTSYKYLAEDVDELCFEADEVIQVVDFDESQEQEEGWLMGVREVNGQRGLFPANFTRPI